MNFQIPTRIFQEDNAVKNHGSEIAHCGKKALIVTGRSSAKKNGALNDVETVLKEFHIQYVIFDEVEENPSVSSIMKAATLGRAEGTDFVIGIGGGSPLDAAKAIALMIQNRDCSEEVLFETVSLRSLPVIAIPTTCGTGSEVTQFAILSRADTQTKQCISHAVYPELALVDSRYLAFAPEKVIIHTAIDTLGHILESYFNNRATDYSRMLSQYAMEVWGCCVPVLCGMEATKEDYDRMMFASTLAGMAFSHTGTTLPHGLSYYLTYHKHIPHGKAVGLFLPQYLKALPEEWDVQVLMALRALGFGSLEQFEGFINGILGKIALSDAEKEAMAASVANNPDKLAQVPYSVTKEDILQMIEEIRE